MSISDDLEKRGLKPKPVILALNDEIAAALMLGHSQKDIWRLLVDQGRLKCSYNVFNAHVNHLVLKRRLTPLESLPTPSTDRPTGPTPQTTVGRLRGEPMPGKKTFSYDPLNVDHLLSKETEK
jgi:hypothetical protein